MCSLHSKSKPPKILQCPTLYNGDTKQDRKCCYHQSISAVYRFSLITALIYSALCYTKEVSTVTNTKALVGP